MSEEQLAALLAKLKNDGGLQEKLKGAADPDAAVALAKEAGFDINKDDWLKYRLEQPFELSDYELNAISGGSTLQGFTTYCNCVTPSTSSPYQSC